MKQVKGKWIGSRKCTMHVLFGSNASPKPVALFEFKIRISLDKHDVEIVHGIDVLKRISAFYEHEEIPIVLNSTCVCLGPSELLVLPNEFDPLDENRPPDYKRFSTWIYNAMTNKLYPTNSPQVPKVNPLAALVDGKVYVFSCRSGGQRDVSIPSFEAFDPETKTWESMPEPFFYHERGWHPTGYAVVGKFILVCFWNSHILPCNAVFSYNTTSKAWKRVHESPPDKIVPDPDDDEDDSLYYDEGYVCDDDDSQERIWDREAVVIGNVIYAYVSTVDRLLSYSCSKASDEGYDLSLAKPVYMEGYEPFRWTHTKFRSRSEDSRIIGKIDDELLCVIHTSFQRFDKHPGYQPVHVEIVRIYGPTHCSIIKSLMLYMPKGDEFYAARLLSCLALQPEVGSSMEHGERDPKKRAVSSKGADDALISEVEMIEASSA